MQRNSIQPLDTGARRPRGFQALETQQSHNFPSRQELPLPTGSSSECYHAFTTLNDHNRRLAATGSHCFAAYTPCWIVPIQEDRTVANGFGTGYRCSGRTYPGTHRCIPLGCHAVASRRWGTAAYSGQWENGEVPRAAKAICTSSPSKMAEALLRRRNFDLDVPSRMNTNPRHHQGLDLCTQFASCLHAR